MRRRFQVVSMAAAAAVGAAFLFAPVLGQAPSAPMTPWGEPDLQGIWAADFVVPLERPPEYGDREFLTEEEVSALNAERAADLYEAVHHQTGRAYSCINAATMALVAGDVERAG